MPPQSPTSPASGDGSRALATIGPPPGTRRAVAAVVVLLVAVVAAGAFGRTDAPPRPAPSVPPLPSAAPPATPRPFALTVVNESSSPYAEVIVNLQRVAVASCSREPVTLEAGTTGLPPLPWTVYAASIRAYDKFEYPSGSGDRTIVVSDAGIEDLSSTPSALPGTTPPPCLGAISPLPSPGIGRDRAVAQAVACAPSSATTPVVESVEVVPPEDVTAPMPVARDGTDWVWAVRLRIHATIAGSATSTVLVAVDFSNGQCLSTTIPAPADSTVALPGLPTAPWGNLRTLALPAADVRRVPNGLPVSASPHGSSWSATSYEPRVYLLNPDVVWVGSLEEDTWRHGRLPLLPGEQVHRVTVVGPRVVAVASRQLGTPPSDGSCPAPGTLGIAWRILAARTDAATLTFHQVDAGRSDRPFRLPGESQTPCGPLDAIVAVGAGRVADVHEVAAGPSRSRIEVHDLSDGSLVRSIPVDRDVADIALSSTALAWSETGNGLLDGERPDWRVMTAPLDAGASRELGVGEVATRETPMPPTLFLDGDAVIASIMRATDGATTIVRVQGHAVAGVAPPFTGQTCMPMGADGGVVVISCSGPNGTWIGAWSAASGLRAVPTPAPQVGELGVSAGRVAWSVLDGSASLLESVPIAALR